MAFILDFQLIPLPQFDTAWGDFVKAGGNTVLAFDAMSADAGTVEKAAKGPWTNVVSEQAERAKAFEDKKTIVSNDLTKNHTPDDAKINQLQGTPVWTPVGTRHAVHSGVTAGSTAYTRPVDVVVGTKTFKLTYAVLIRATFTDAKA